MTGEYAAFFMPANTGRVTFDVRKAPALAAQTVTVRVDGRVVDRRSLTDDAWRTLDYAVEARDADNSPFGVELLVGPAWRDADDNPRGVLLRGDPLNDAPHASPGGSRGCAPVSTAGTSAGSPPRRGFG